MKQLFSIVAGVLMFADIFSFGACTSASNASAAVQVDSAALKNLAANNAVNRAIESGDMSNLGDYIASDAVDHSGAHGDVVGLDSIKAELAPVHKIASGGELSRFMLAMKVALARVKSTPSIIFDEIDTGTGGAVADAIGKRLAKLANPFVKQMKAAKQRQRKQIDRGRDSTSAVGDHWTLAERAGCLERAP